MDDSSPVPAIQPDFLYSAYLAILRIRREHPESDQLRQLCDHVLDTLVAIGKLIPTRSEPVDKGAEATELIPGALITIREQDYVILDPFRYKYDYPKDKCKCPVCGGLGIPWGGWFSCERCSCVALVDTGQAFVRIASEE